MYHYRLYSTVVYLIISVQKIAFFSEISELLKKKIIIIYL